MCSQLNQDLHILFEKWIRDIFHLCLTYNWFVCLHNSWLYYTVWYHPQQANLPSNSPSPNPPDIMNSYLLGLYQPSPWVSMLLDTGHWTPGPQPGPLLGRHMNHSSDHTNRGQGTAKWILGPAGRDWDSLWKKMMKTLNVQKIQKISCYSSASVPKGPLISRDHGMLIHRD